MYVQRKVSVHVCFVRDKEADGKRHIDGHRVQGEELLGDPLALQSPAATGVRLSPCHRHRGTNNQQSDKIKRKVK